MSEGLTTRQWLRWFGSLRRRWRKEPEHPVLKDVTCYAPLEDKVLRAWLDDPVHWHLSTEWHECHLRPDLQCRIILEHEVDKLVAMVQFREGQNGSSKP